MPGPLPAGRDRFLDRLARCQYRAGHRRLLDRWRHRHELVATQTVYRGLVSIFDDGSTADGRPGPHGACIALRRDAVDEPFLLKLAGRRGIVTNCDYGPDESTGRTIDIMPAALDLLRVYFDPTDTAGSATLLHRWD